MKKRVLGRRALEVSEVGLGGLFVASWYSKLEDAKKTVRRAVEESLRLLGRDRVDMLLVHEPDRPGQYDWWRDRENFTGPVTEVIDELKTQGIVRFSGIGGTTAYEIVPLIESGRFDVLLTAFNYSLLWREAEIAVLPAAKAQNMGTIIGSPLQQGTLARRYDDEVNFGAPWLSLPRRKQYKELYAFLDEIQMPIAEAAVRFVISNPDIGCVLTGARWNSTWGPRRRGRRRAGSADCGEAEARLGRSQAHIRRNAHEAAPLG